MTCNTFIIILNVTSFVLVKLHKVYIQSIFVQLFVGSEAS